MATPEELAAQKASDDAAAAKAQAEAEALKSQNHSIDVDLFDGVKLTMPKDQAQKVISARDAFKAEVKTAKEGYATIQAQLAEATAKVKDFETKLPEWQEAQKRAGDLTVKITELEKISNDKKAADEALAKILETKMTVVPEGMKSLVKGQSTLEKLQSYEELFAAGVFRIPNPGARKPGESPISEMTYDQFNTLNAAQQANIQRDVREGKIKLVAGAPK